MKREKLFAYALPLMIYIVICAIVSGVLSFTVGYEFSEKLRLGFVFGGFVVIGWTYYKNTKDE